MQHTTTNFREDLKLQKEDIHRIQIKKFIAHVSSIDPDSIKFQKSIGNVPHKDDCASFILKGREVKVPSEYKTDYQTFWTGNIVIELVSSIKPSYLPKIPLGKVSEGGFFFREVERVIDEIEKGNIKASMGLGMLSVNNLPKHYLFSYLMANDSDALKLQRVEDAYDYLIFSPKTLIPFVKDNYKDNPFSITESEKDGVKWRTIGSLMKLEDVYHLALTNSTYRSPTRTLV